MWIFLARRLLSLPPLLLVISFLTYLLLQASPGDFYSSREFDPKFTQDYIMALRQAVGKVEEIPAERRAAALPEFRPEGREYAFDAVGRLLRDGKRTDPAREQMWVKKFEWPPASGQTWTLTQEGRLYRWISKVRGYFVWLGNVCTGEFGESWHYKQPVAAVMWDGMRNTLLLEIVALSIAWGLAIPLGVWSGVRPNSAVDHACGAFAYMSLSIPTVFLSLLALLFALATGWFPVGDMRDKVHWDAMNAWQKTTDVAWHLILPSLVIGLTQVAIFMRQTRGQMVETMSSDYVRTARAKGVPHNTVIFKHALRNAINPLVTLFGLSLAALLSGSFLVEYVFNWPGLARVTIDAVFAKDEPLVMASVLTAAIVLVAGNVVADVLLAIVDPKIRLE